MAARRKKRLRTPRARSGEPRTSSAAGRAGDVLALQRAAGNSAVIDALRGHRRGSAVIQRMALRTKLAPQTIKRLEEDFHDKIVDDLQAFHDVLVNPGSCRKYLKELDARVASLLSQSDGFYTRALVNALAQEEQTWMDLSPKGPKTRERIEVREGLVTTKGLLGHLEVGRPLKDVGAAISHGEWAHRIQLWILACWARENGKNARQLYTALQVVDEKNDLFGDEPPPVWSWVLDIPNDLVTTKKKLAAEDVGAAAPARLTMGLTGVGGEDAYAPIPGLPNLRRALLNRRLKRFVEARDRQHELANEFRHKFGGLVQQEEDLVRLTTPGSGAERAFKEHQTLGRAQELVDWLGQTSYFVWMSRQDVSLRGAIEKLSAEKAGNLAGLVKTLGTPYNQPYAPVGKLKYKQLDAIVVILMEALGDV